MLRLYGEEVIPLGKLVHGLCLKQGNMKETNIFQQLVYAQQIWKELFRSSIWEIKNQVLEVDCKRHTIRLPEDCERLINISVIDRAGKLQPLSCDPGLSTVEIKCIKNKCSCNTCNGQDTLCGVMDAVSYTTETVEIQGEPYQLRTWKRYSNGAIQQEQNIPTLNATTNEVEYTTVYETLCNVETTDKGCIKWTSTNMELLRGYCGVGNFPENQYGVSYDWYRGSANLIPQVYNFYGYWNVNAENRDIIHIFRHDHGGHQPHEQHGIDKVVVSYQTNGETPGDEILIPQYAQLAVETGVMWLQKYFNPKASISDKQYMLEQYRARVQKVNKHLNPIRIEVVRKLQSNERRW